jgi:hypothetical protein
MTCDAQRPPAQRRLPTTVAVGCHEMYRARKQQLKPPAMLTSSSLPSLPTRAVSTMPSSGSAASASAAGTASCHMSLSHFERSQDSCVLLLLLLASELPAAGTAALLRSGAAFTSDEAAALTAAVADLHRLLRPSCAVPAEQHASGCHQNNVCSQLCEDDAKVAARKQGFSAKKAIVRPPTLTGQHLAPEELLRRLYARVVLVHDAAVLDPLLLPSGRGAMQATSVARPRVSAFPGEAFTPKLILEASATGQGWSDDVCMWLHSSNSRARKQLSTTATPI